MKRVQDSARRAGLKEVAAAIEAQQGVYEAVLGFQNEGRAAAERAMQESRSPRVVLQSASVLALAGDEARALKLPETLHCRGLSIPWFSMCKCRW